MSKAWTGGSTREWRKLRLRVLIRDNYRCQIKGRDCLTIANTVDHIIPKVEGGRDVIENLRAACAPCNYGRSTPAPIDPLPSTTW